MGCKMYRTTDGRCCSDVGKSYLVLFSQREELNIHDHIIFNQAAVRSDLILTCRFLKMPHVGLP